MNITDVGHLESDSDTGEDKMALGAKREGKTVWEIARFYEEKFCEDCVKLNITRPTVSCRATEHIDHMIKFIQKLEEKGYDSIYYRFMCLLTRYRKQLVFSYGALDKAKQEYESLKEKIKKVYKASASNEEQINNDKTSKYVEKFREQINDDLNTPNGITLIYEVLKDKELEGKEKLFIINEFDKVFSLELLNFDNDKKQSDIDEDKIQKLLIERLEARKNKDWSKADEIRDKLAEMNIEIIDNKEGSTWRVNEK